MLVDPMTHLRDHYGVYIDDIATMTVNLPEKSRRAKAEMTLAMHALGRPQYPQEHTPRNNMISISKLETEGSPIEQIAILNLTPISVVYPSPSLTTSLLHD